MEPIVVAYVVYLAVSALFTVRVGRTLSRPDQVFLDRAFVGDEKLASSVNQLLVVGFYLVNAGFVALNLRSGRSVASVGDVFALLSVKLGTVILVLGILHLANLFVVNQMRHTRERARLIPSVGPEVAAAPFPTASAPVAPAGFPVPAGCQQPTRHR